MSEIYLYAELLLNIRQVTVFAILPSYCNKTTHLGLQADKRTLFLKHEGEQSTIELPCQVVNDADLDIPPASTRELSFRLGVNGAAKLSVETKLADDINFPWSAPVLTAETRIACQRCRSLLINDVTVWKDLPSGGWAEMMDFWHCHKPHVEGGDHSSVGATKGYAASNFIGPTAGVGLVDVTHFLLSERDCYGLQVPYNFF